ncbi:outer membrane protein assembly factor BamB family protein [Niabella ginsengisoli]|uniref:PQQ-like beta-propeller repeat protein n=1 Tax=Niabella ginsengisoli TaxID=522298 RepID=A0ABS9SPL4_9BACT|nr:PQQ-binding-like beta-propeller repeat protein [Niabella ginsengisoli]MCH5600353.1 PQQ-like beta-propeller repeat protein [Niabella ginsengisoli]
MRIDNKFFILSNGRVAAIDKKTGDIVWEIKLKEYVKTTTSYAVGQIVLEDSKLYVSVSGVIVCLNAKDGSLIWKNELKGWGYSFVSMTGNDQAVAGAEAASVQASNAATTGSSM